MEELTGSDVMLKRGERICPCCGKPLVLIPPTKELLPNRFGVSENDIPFYLASDPRYIPYTLHPDTMSEFNSSVLFEDVKIGANWLCNMGMSSHRPRYDGRKIVTVYRTQRMLTKNLLMTCAMYAVAFFCKNCNQKIALTFHPMSIFDNYFFVFISAAALVSFFAKCHPIISVVSFAVCCISLLTALAALVSCLFVKLFMSNFVVTDLRDNMIIPKSELNISRNGLKRIFLHRSNIYETELDGERFYLYLTEKGKTDLKLHICGTDGEPERLLTLIREKRESSKTVTLPLTFEGKSVGTAEVTEIYENKDRGH